MATEDSLPCSQEAAIFSTVNLINPLQDIPSCLILSSHQRIDIPSVAHQNTS